MKKGVPLKGGQPKGDANGKPKGMCFNYNEVRHYSKDCPKSKLGNEGFKVITLIDNLAEVECNCLIFLKGKVSKRHMGLSQLHNPRKSIGVMPRVAPLAKAPY
jgi:hypothetical protein